MTTTSYVHVQFRRTNENLDAISSGLNIAPQDRVLAICGSGDQAFALLAEAKEVVAIDNDQAQIEFAKKRLQALQDDDMDTFFDSGRIYPDDREKRRRDFFTEARLSRIREKLDAISFISQDVRSTESDKEFSKIYLSNVLDYCCDGNGNILPSTSKDLRKIVGSLGPAGLVYLATGSRRVEEGKARFFPSRERYLFYEGGVLTILPKSIKLDEERTAAARSFKNDTWIPSVYRRVKE
jgi:hypothetical protein